MNKTDFCCVLKDHPDVLKQSRIYPYINTKYDKKDIPEVFDGREVWAMYIQTPSKEKSSTSWAIVAKDILNDRFSLFTAAQLHFFLDYIDIIMCTENIPHKKLNNVPSTNSLNENIDDNEDASQGYSIYDAWEYLYAHGLSQWNCISRRFMVLENIVPPDMVKYKDKTKLYEKLCESENLQSVCMRKFEGKPVARRIFFANTIFNIEGKDMTERIMNIKYQIAKWGPVAAGFLVYENFVNTYKGTDVYTKAEGKILGGHYVSILGWGKDFWICRNNFGPNWGLMGYFYMKMGLEECKLEYNVSSIGPGLSNYKEYSEADVNVKKNGLLYDGKPVSVDDMKTINPKIFKIRESHEVDYSLFYTKKTVKLIKEGKLFGTLTPLIVYPKLLPNLEKFWLKNLKYYDYVNLAGKTFYEDYKEDDQKKKPYNIYFIIFICIFLFILGLSGVFSSSRFLKLFSSSKRRYKKR
jgi:hypothetical protein